MKTQYSQKYIIFFKKADLWQIDGEIVPRVADYFLGSKLTADGDCSHEIKRCLLLGRKVTTNLDSVMKGRDSTCQQSDDSAF